MERTFSEIKDAILERIKNPFLGSLILFWLVLNWKSVFYLIFSDLSIETRFYNIENNYYSFLRAFVLPPVFAFLYTAYKDLVFNYIETESRKSERVRRKNINTETIQKYQEAAAIATERARVKHIADEYPRRNELTEKIRDLEGLVKSEQANSKGIQLKFVEERGVLSDLIDSYKSKENKIYDYEILEEVRRFLDDNNDEATLDELSELVSYSVNNFPFSNLNDTTKVLKKLEKYPIGTIVFDENNKLLRFDLNSVGFFLLHRSIFKGNELKEQNIKFTPNFTPNIPV